MDPIFLGKLLGAAAYIVFEYWLGKTDKVKSASTLELVIEGAKKLISVKKV